MSNTARSQLRDQVAQKLTDEVMMEVWRQAGAALCYSQQHGFPEHETACVTSLRNNLLSALGPVLDAAEQLTLAEKGRALMKQAGYTLVLWQCTSCDAVFPTKHVSDCPKAQP